MDFYKFVASLESDEIRSLEFALKREKDIRFLPHASPLTDTEKMIAKSDKIAGIKQYRIRTGFDLFIAKTMVEKYLGGE